MMETGKFLARIGLAADTPVTHDVAFLGSVQTGCVIRIAYENLDILSGKAIDLAPEKLYDKIVTRGRGGYCFELNGLLTHMLRAMGFTVTERFARYLRGETELPMRRHRICIVHLPEGDYMLDIGVGQIAPRLPLKIETQTVQEQNGETYRFIRHAEHGWILQDLHHGEWRDYICFTDIPAHDVDFVQPTFYCEHHADSPFNKEPMIAIKTPEGRRTIDGRVYKVFAGEKLMHIEEDISDARMAQLLENEFMIKPEGK